MTISGTCRKTPLARSFGPLSMIRAAVEDCAPPGVVINDEYLPPAP